MRTPWLAALSMGHCFIISCLAVVISACASTPVEFQANSSPKTPVRGGVAEFKLLSYDGKYMKARVLIGATAEAFAVDGRMVECVHLEVRKVRSCDKNELLQYYEVDWSLNPIRPEEIIHLRPGAWYGANVNFLLFAEEMKVPRPDCFEADLMVWTLDRRIAATLPIRVTRTDTPPVPRETESPPEHSKPEVP